MLNPIVSLYVATTARTATVTPSPTHTPDRLRPGRGFHWRRPGTGGGYGADGQDTSTVLLVAICAAAVVVALAAWLFLLWREKQRRAAYAAPHSPDPEAARWER